MAFQLLRIWRARLRGSSGAPNADDVKDMGVQASRNSQTSWRGGKEQSKPNVNEIAEVITLSVGERNPQPCPICVRATLTQ